MTPRKKNYTFAYEYENKPELSLRAPAEFSNAPPQGRSPLAVHG